MSFAVWKKINQEPSGVILMLINIFPAILLLRITIVLRQCIASFHTLMTNMEILQKVICRVIDLGQCLSFCIFQDLVLLLLFHENICQYVNCKVICHRFCTVNLFSSIICSHSNKKAPWMWFVLPHVWKHTISVRVSMAVINHHDQKSTLEEKSLFHLILLDNSPSLRKAREQNWRQKLTQKPERNIAYWLLPYDSLSLFSYSIQDHNYRGYKWATSIMNQEYAL